MLDIGCTRRGFGKVETPGYHHRESTGRCTCTGRYSDGLAEHGLGLCEACTVLTCKSKLYARTRRIGHCASAMNGDLPKCRHRVSLPECAQWVCRSSKLIIPGGLVTERDCIRCPVIDHEDDAYQT